MVSLLASVGLFIGGFALIYHNWLLGGLSVAFITLCVYGWALEGVGGHYLRIRPSERRNTGLAAISASQSTKGPPTGVNPSEAR